jgi:hypothetical protein
LSILMLPNDYLCQQVQSGVENQQTNPERDSSREHRVRKVRRQKKSTKVSSKYLPVRRINETKQEADT